MSQESLVALDTELAALLDSERGAEAPADALGRVWGRVLVAPPLLVSAPAPHVAPASAAHGWLASHAIGVATAAFLAGGAAGAAVYAAAQPPPPERIVYVERPAPYSPTPNPAPIPAPAPDPTPISRTPTPIAAPPAPSSTSLSAERTLLDGARNALASHDAATALTLLADHRRRFPKPQLAEERDALTIQSLVALGRYDDARSAAARFKAATPGSLFLPAIEASLASIP